MEINPKYVSSRSNRKLPISSLLGNLISPRANIQERIPSAKRRELQDFSKLQRTNQNCDVSTEISTRNNLNQFYLNKIFKHVDREKNTNSVLKRTKTLKEFSFDNPDSKLISSIITTDLNTKRGLKAIAITKIPLNELLAIKPIKSFEFNGTVRRMLHLPSFKIYDLTNESIAEMNTFEKNHLKKSLLCWKNLDTKNSKLAKIIDLHWNNPEESVTILQEPSKYGYLSVYSSHSD
jgi:hypothetical protein